MTKITNEKQSNVWNLRFGYWSLFVIWCLRFVIFHIHPCYVFIFHLDSYFLLSGVSICRMIKSSLKL